MTLVTSSGTAADRSHTELSLLGTNSGVVGSTTESTLCWSSTDNVTDCQPLVVCCVCWRETERRAGYSAAAQTCTLNILCSV